MTFTPDDLDAAVDTGILDAKQAKALQDFLTTRHQTPPGRNENVRVVNNFGEVFICIGQIMVFTNLSFMPDLIGTLTLPLAAVVYWIMAEFFTFKRLRLAPAIVATILFAVLALRSFAMLVDGNSSGFGELVFSGHAPYYLALAFFLIAAFARFRLPVLLLPLAGAATAWAYFFAVSNFPNLPLFGILGTCGIIILATAIWLDSLDPLRRSRTTAYAFWLFLIGSPMTIHPLFISLILSENFTQAMLFVLGCAILATLLGLLLDRRSLVASSLIYFAVSINHMNQKMSGDTFSAISTTLFIIGMGVILLGTFWYPIRSKLMSMLPRLSFLSKLPPYA